MDFYQIYSDIREYGFEITIVIAILMKCIEISPLKLNPWSRFKKWMANLFQGGLNKRLDEITLSVSKQGEDILEMKRDLNEERAKTARYRIIRFDDEMTHDMRHSTDHCEQIMEDIATYEDFCEKRPYIKNHKGVAAMKRITDRYNNKLPM